MTVPTVSLPGGQQVCLGRIRPVAAFDYGAFRVRDYPDGSREVTLRLKAYYDKADDAAPPPDSTNYAANAGPSIARMYLNDRYGDCVIASKYHSVGLWTAAESGTPALGTDAEVLAQYHGICGPGDNGCNIVQVLKAFQTKGLPFGGAVHKIDGFVSVDHTNKNLVMVALDLFGSGPLGINLPSAWTQGGDGSTWDVTNTGVVGGHDVAYLDYDVNKGVKIATWGGTRWITWPAFLSKKWVEEMEVLLSPDWYALGSLAPNGINADALRADLAALGSGQIPPIDVPPPAVVDWNQL